MSVSCEAYIGYTVTLATNLTNEDFRFFDEHEIDLPRVRLIVDGMCGNYARLIYVDREFCCLWDDAEYFALKSPEITDKIYEALNESYKSMYDKDLERDRIEYALSFHFY